MDLKPSAVTGRQALVFCLFVILAGSGVGRIAAQPSAPALPVLTEPVNDFANVIDPVSAAEMERMIRNLQEKTGDVVVVSPSMAAGGVKHDGRVLP